MAPGTFRSCAVRRYLETIFLSLTAFLLMVPTVTETLRRVPDGPSFVTDPKAPLLLEAQASLLVLLLTGLTAQITHLRQHGRLTAVVTPGKADAR